jgi:hypothetical protein
MTEPAYRIIEWLARVHGQPRKAEAEWQAQGVALLPMGDRLSAIRLRGELVHAACGTDDPGQVAAALAELLDGAVIRDRPPADVTYYALIEAHAGLVWDREDDAPCLGDGFYLGVPALHRLAPPGPYWVLPPRRESDLCRPQAVRDLIATGLERLHPAECR